MANLKINAELSKKQTIGVEIEMSNISKRKVCSIVCKYFKDKYNILSETVYDGRHLDNWYCIGRPDADGNERRWQMMNDGSIHGAETCELVTPILTYDDIEDLQEIVRLLRKAGAVSGTRYNAGVHIHIGADFDRDGGQNAKTIRNLVNLIKSHESLICNAVSVSPERQRQWARFVEPEFLARLNRQKPTTKDKLFALWYGSEREYNNVVNNRRANHYHTSRYHLLNLHSVIDKGTIEFRCFEFHNNLHAGELKAWIQLCLAMCSYAKITRNCRIKELQTDNQKYAMAQWLKNMGLIGNEFKTCRKMLTKHLSGDTAYRHGRPVEDNLDDYALDR